MHNAEAGCNETRAEAKRREMGGLQVDDVPRPQHQEAEEQFQMLISSYYSTSQTGPNGGGLLHPGL